MKNHLFAISSLLVATASFSQDLASPTSYAITTEAKLTTSRINRGISESALRPSAAITVNVAHESGLAGLVELGTVSKDIFRNGNELIFVVAGGYRNGEPDAFHYGAGFYYETFPGASYRAPQSQAQILSGQDSKANFNSGFGVIEAGYGPIEFRYEHLLTERIRGISTASLCGVEQNPMVKFACFSRGDQSTRGAGYLSVIAKYNITPELQLSGHIGTQRTKNLSEYNFTDYRASIDYSIGQWVLGADLTSAKVKRQDLYTFTRANGSTFEANKTNLALRVKYKF